MKLIDMINDYVTLQQSLGKCFKSTSRLLRQFGRAMGDIQIGEVRPQAVTEFLRGTGLLSNVGTKIQGVVWAVSICS